MDIYKCFIVCLRLHRSLISLITEACICSLSFSEVTYNSHQCDLRGCISSLFVFRGYIELSSVLCNMDRNSNSSSLSLLPVSSLSISDVHSIKAMLVSELESDSELDSGSSLLPVCPVLLLLSYAFSLAITLAYMSRTFSLLESFAIMLISLRSPLLKNSFLARCLPSALAQFFKV